MSVILSTRDKHGLGEGSELITSWTNEEYDTFSSTGNVINSAIGDGSPGEWAITNIITPNDGDYIHVVAVCTLNSGTAPYLRLQDYLISDEYDSHQMTTGTHDYYIYIDPLWVVDGNQFRFMLYDMEVATNFTLTLSVKRSIV